MAGSKRERQPGVWELRVSTGKDPVTGRYRTVSRIHHGTTSTADKALARLVTEVEDKLHGGTEGTVSHLMIKWLALSERNGRSPTTLRTYRSYLKANIGPALGKVELRRLTAEHLDDFYAQLTVSGGHSGNGRSTSTIHQHHSMISAALGQAVKWGLVRSNVALLASPPSVRHAEIRPPTIDEIRKLIVAAESANPALAVLLFVATTTGARRGELAGLRWVDVDLASATLQIAHSVIDVYGDQVKARPKDTKTHQVRNLSLDDTTVLVLAAHRARMETERERVTEDSYVFSQAADCSEPYRPDRITGFFRRLRATLDLEGVNLHDLRHFSATQLIASGVDIRTVAGRHGWADASVMLKTYAAFTQPADRRAADIMGQLGIRSDSPT
jgi:integrase